MLQSKDISEPMSADYSEMSTKWSHVRSETSSNLNKQIECKLYDFKFSSETILDRGTKR